MTGYPQKLSLTADEMEDPYILLRRNNSGENQSSFKEAKQQKSKPG